ncbi:MAG: iron ABC transporter permease [Sphaerochaetaceae bacterium]|jgi:iron complex transport system permease protein|nr:iron ABC transporter permease [Sphaerochaetaceae bacterium]
MVSKRYYSLIWITLLALLVAVVLISLALGPAGITVKQTVLILKEGPTYTPNSNFSSAQHRIIWYLRLPRILTALVAGMVLAISGMVYQALFRNPMADPYVLGISSGAAFGVAFATFLGLVGGATGVYQVPVAAFIGAIVATWAIFILSGGARRSPTVLLLTGIALNFLLSALMSLFMYLNRAQLHSIMQWSMGSFATANWEKLLIMASVSLVALLPITLLTRELDILLLDDASALSVGVSVRRIRLTLLILTTLATSVTVAFCGIIGFVGLMVPHIMRLVVGPKHKNLLLFSLLGGALMMVTADTLSRVVLGATELPVGIITAIGGSPLFIILLIRNKKEMV